MKKRKIEDNDVKPIDSKQRGRTLISSLSKYKTYVEEILSITDIKVAQQHLLPNEALYPFSQLVDQKGNIMIRPMDRELTIQEKTQFTCLYHIRTWTKNIKRCCNNNCIYHWKCMTPEMRLPFEWINIKRMYKHRLGDILIWL